MSSTHGTMDQPEMVERVNQRYWDTADTVEQIVGDLGIGRSTLYGSVQPRAAGESCDACGDPMVFTNRKAREQGMPSCPSCGGRRAPEAGSTYGAGAAGNGRSTEVRRGAMDALSRWKEELAAVPPERAAIVGGAAALGVMVGAAATRAVRDRR